MTKKSEKVKAWRRRTKERLCKAFGSKCGICGYNKCTDALEYHHIDPTTKEFGLGQRRASCVSWARLCEEARKCVMLCSNCHKEVHAGIAEIPDDILRFDENYADYKNMSVV